MRLFFSSLQRWITQKQMKLEGGFQVSAGYHTLLGFTIYIVLLKIFTGQKILPSPVTYIHLCIVEMFSGMNFGVAKHRSH